MKYLAAFFLIGMTGVSFAQESPEMSPQAIAAAQGNFKQCLRGLWPQAQTRGISQEIFNRELSDIEPDMSLMRLMTSQPEFEKPLWSYVDDLVNPTRIAKGRQMIAHYKAIWPRMEQQYGVDRYTLIGLWAVETNFGTSMGEKPVIRSTATLACIGRRQDYFQKELLAALQIVQAQDIPSSKLRGSWAGAFGHTQFMPSTFKPYAVDFDGDGHKNIIGSVPDSLASTANNLKATGWKPGKSWGYEVILPRAVLPKVGETHSLDEWTNMGLKRPGNKLFKTGSDTATLTLPAGATGPAFLLTKNFDQLKSYNGSEAYAYAVGHLADRMMGGAAFYGKWPRNIRMLSRDERQELQQRLASAGFETGGSEGRIGAQTRKAIRAYQTSVGLPADGFPTPDLLERLRH